MTSGWTCAGCAHSNPKTARFCAACGTETSSHGPVVTSARPIPSRYGSRAEDPACRIHRCALDPTGWCPVAQAWWTPTFRCPACAGPLWPNGFCATCTPARHHFTGDYFEARWDDQAGREWGHYVRVQKGPTPVPSEPEVAGYLTALQALARARTVDAVPF
jgi:hypothetical protein